MGEHRVDGHRTASVRPHQRLGWPAALAAGRMGGQAVALGLVDQVAMDVVPSVFGSGKRYFGEVSNQYMLEDPDVVIQGRRVLHLRYPVRH